MTPRRYHGGMNERCPMRDQAIQRGWQIWHLQGKTNRSTYAPPHFDLIEARGMGLIKKFKSSLSCF